MRVGFRRRIWIGVGWRLRPALRVVSAVVGEEREGVWGLVAGDRVRQRFDDRRRLAVVGVTQSADPDDSVLVTHTREVGSRPRVMREYRHRQRQAPSVGL